MRWRSDVDPGYLVATIILIVGAAAALSVDVVRSGFGVKGDEATYVAMALSAAYDGDLAYERRDLERFYQIYRGGPEGIFLKRGRQARLEVGGEWPFVSVRSRPTAETDRLYFGKAYVHAVAAAPFVRLWGLNGLLLFHVVLLVGVLLAAYRFLAARSPRGVALAYAMAFVGASIVPLYAVWLTSEIFNVALVSLAYFLWFYKEVAPPASSRVGRLGRGTASDVVAAVLLGVATFSKPSNLLLIGPPVLWRWWQRRFGAGLAVGAVCAGVVAGAFGVNALVSGELNYQGGERRTYYGSFPFESPDAGFAARGTGVSTNAITVDEPLDESGAAVLARNAWYFLVGRHFGFIPFFFPGAMSCLIALLRWRSLRAWHAFVAGAVALSVAVMLFYLPYSWSGGGGPSGNRYFLSIYPALLFLTPPLESFAPALLTWLVGGLFTAQILVSPFVSAKQPYLAPQHGVLRWLPVELTMINDLPVMLDAGRSRIPVGEDPTLLVYLLDDNSWRPEPTGIWIAGKSRAEIIVRTSEPLETLLATFEAPVANRVTVDASGGSQTLTIEPGRPVTVALAPRGVYSRRSWAYVLSVRTAGGFVPRLIEPGSGDSRFLGAVMRLSGRTAARPVPP